MLNKKKIYVVDDDKDIRRLTQAKLSENYDIKEFSHWQDVKRYLAKGLPDLFILDVMFDDSNILNFLKFRSDNYDINKVPVIIFSALKNKRILTQVFSYEVAEYIMKPFIPTMVENAVKRIFHERKKSYVFSNEEFFQIDMPIDFYQFSETEMVAETDMRLLQNTEYEIESEFFSEAGVPTGNLLAFQNSRISDKTRRFETPFRLRSSSEKLLQKN